mmetsp:Transcript_116487/g.325825  ORF Transcript_116487/g.325825 Transcript_116487/m.325825 type:complete len:246 (-) Transcript_116487:265-1002(-)
MVRRALRVLVCMAPRPQTALRLRGRGGLQAALISLAGVLHSGGGRRHLLAGHVRLEPAGLVVPLHASAPSSLQHGRGPLGGLHLRGLALHEVPQRRDEHEGSVRSQRRDRAQRRVRRQRRLRQRRQVAARHVCGDIALGVPLAPRRRGRLFRVRPGVPGVHRPRRLWPHLRIAGVAHEPPGVRCLPRPAPGVVLRRAAVEEVLGRSGVALCLGPPRPLDPLLLRRGHVVGLRRDVAPRGMGHVPF